PQRDPPEIIPIYAQVMHSAPVGRAAAALWWGHEFGHGFDRGFDLEFDRAFDHDQHASSRSGTLCRTYSRTCFRRYAGAVARQSDGLAQYPDLRPHRCRALRGRLPVLAEHPRWRVVAALACARRLYHGWCFRFRSEEHT